MGIASLTLGIISLIMSLIPGLGIFFCITAVMGIIFGIISLCKKLDKGKSIAGIITSCISIVITILYIVAIVVIIGGENGLARRIEKQQSKANIFPNVLEVKKCTVGQTFNDGKIAITFVSADDNYKGYKENANIKEGYKIIRAEFEFENVGNSNQYISSYKFDCYADQYDCNRFWSVEDKAFSKTLSSGKKTKGAVYFQVPENSKSILLEYDAKTSKHQTVEFIVK